MNFKQMLINVCTFNVIVYNFYVHLYRQLKTPWKSGKK